MKKKIFLVVLLISILLVLGILFYIYSQPSRNGLSKEFKEEAVEKLLGRQAVLDKENIPQGDTGYKGKYFSFSYPQKALIYEYREASHQENSNLEDFSFDIKNPKIVFNASVAENSSKFVSIEEVPSVKLRMLRSDYEKKEIKVIGGSGLTFFNNAKEVEKSAFFLSNNRIYTVSITGNDSQEVEKLFDGVMSSLSLY